MLATSARRLGPDDARALSVLLDAEPVLNVYLRSEVRLGALRFAPWWGVGEGSRLVAALLAGPLAVPWLPQEELAAAFGGALNQPRPPSLIVGQRTQALALHRARPSPPPLREVRDPQPVMVLPRGAMATAVRGGAVRRGQRGDLDHLTVAAAAMHREEMGVDPLALDPAGWRARMASLVERGWSYVWVEGDRVIFKAELSAWTPEAAQIQGVWTEPGSRNRGVGTAGMAAVCADVLRDVPACSLYVNHFNAPALAVYRRLGFEPVAEFATLLY